MNLSTNKPRLCSAALVLLLGACGPGTPESASTLSARFAVPSTLNCADLNPETVRGPIQRLLVQTGDASETWSTYQSIEGPFDTAQDYDIELPPSDGPLRFLACEGTESRWVAFGPNSLTPNSGSTLRLSFAPVNQLACTDTIDSTGASQRNPWDAAGAFGTHGVIDETILLFEGVSAYDPGRDTFHSQSPTRITRYDPSEGAFLPISGPGAERLPSRAGAVSIPFTDQGEDGVAIVGGSAELKRDITFPLGPFAPVRDENGCYMGADTAVFIGPDASARPIGPEAGSFLGRVFAQTATSAGLSVIAGGIECEDGQASDTIEIVRAGQVSRIQLPVSLAGASVSAIGSGRFLLWGHDLDNCGRQPGWILNTAGAPSVESLTLNVSVPDGCGMAPTECPTWHPSGYHTATVLSRGAAGAKVLVTGGLIGQANKLANNPTVRAQCPGNAFVLSISGTTGEISPATRVGMVPSTQRAFHTAVNIDGQIIISGGWVASREDGNASATPGALYTSNRWLVFDASSGQLRAGGKMAVGRLGHLGIHLPNGQALLAGGLRPGGAGSGPFLPVGIAELWTTSPKPADCSSLIDN